MEDMNPVVLERKKLKLNKNHYLSHNWHFGLKRVLMQQNCKCVYPKTFNRLAVIDSVFDGRKPAVVLSLHRLKILIALACAMIRKGEPFL